MGIIYTKTPPVSQPVSAQQQQYDALIKKILRLNQTEQWTANAMVAIGRMDSFTRRSLEMVESPAMLQCIINEFEKQGIAPEGQRGTPLQPAIQSTPMSSVTAQDWQRIQSAVGVCNIVVVSDPPISVKHVTSTKPFEWRAGSESSPTNIAAALEYFNTNLRPPDKHEWINCSESRSLLNFTLPGAAVALSGTSHIALCVSAAVAARLARNGLRMVVELKKEGNIGRQYQLAAELVAANFHSPHLKPIAVLTDLVDFWLLMWLGPEGVMTYPCQRGRGEAIGILRAFMEQERLTPNSSGIVQQEERHTRRGAAAGEAGTAMLLKRRRLQLGPGPSDVANLDDLQDFPEVFGKDDEAALGMMKLAQQLHYMYTDKDQNEATSPPMEMFS